MNPSSSNNSNNINNNGRGSSGGVDGTQPPEPSIAAASARTHASAASATSAAYDGAENPPTATTSAGKGHKKKSHKKKSHKKKSDKKKSRKKKVEDEDIGAAYDGAENSPTATETSPPAATSAFALPPPPAAAAATATTTTTTDIDTPPSDDMENAIKETVEDNEDDAPLHHSTADAGIDDIDEENQNKKPRARTGANENDDAARMAAVTPPPVGRDADIQAQPPPSAPPLRSLLPFHRFSRSSPPIDPQPTSTPASSTPPSKTAPPTTPREPSVPTLEATIVPNMPVYDGVEVIEVQHSWFQRKQKYIIGAVSLLSGVALTVAASVLIPRPSDNNISDPPNNNVNEEVVQSGSSTSVSGSPSSSSSPPSNSISLSENPPFSPSSPLSLWPTSPPPIPLPPSTYWSSLNWNQEGQDINGESSNDWLGRAVALSADGTIMAVGAPGNWFDDDRLGHVKIFFREGKGSSWEQRGDTLYGESNGDAFGSSVSLSGDGNTLFIGAPYNDGNGQYSGSVAVYRWDGVTLNYKQRGDALRGEAKYDQFGISLDLSSDGEVLAVGSPYTDSNGPFSGRVQVYAWDLVSSTYEQLGQAINGSAAGDSFGRSVSLSGDGTKLAVGAEENDSNGEDSGQVRLFELNESDMSYKPLGDPLNGDAPGDWFGSSVSLSDDGTTLAIGALFNAINGNDSGQVKIFKFDDTTVNFKQRGPSLYGIAAEDRFGYSVVLSSDGNTLVVGASQRYADKPGFVKAFRLDEDALVYKQLGQTLNGNGSGDQFGYAVALSEDDKTLAVGAPFNDEDGVDSGEAKMYNIDLSAPPPSTHPSESFSPTMLPTSPPSTHPSESFSPSMSPTSPPSTHPSKSFSPTETCYWIDVSVVFDEYSDETSWDVQRINDVGANIVVKAYNGIDDDANTLRKESMCLEEGQYEFTIYDSCGDGLVSDFDYDDDYIYNISVPGHYNVTSYGELIVEGAKFDHSEATLFSLPLPSAPSASP